MQSVSKYPVIVTFHLSADSLNLGQPQNGIFGKGLTPGFLPLITERKRRLYAIIYNIKCTLPQNTKVYHTFSNHNIPNFTVLLYRIPYLTVLNYTYQAKNIARYYIIQDQTVQNIPFLGYYSML